MTSKIVSNVLRSELRDEVLQELGHENEKLVQENEKAWLRKELAVARSNIEKLKRFTLRDRFAISIINAFIITGDSDWKQMATNAYLLADELIIVKSAPKQKKGKE